MLEIDRPAGNEQESEAYIPSFKFVYTQYYQRVYHYFRIRLNNDEDTADLTQQVFFQVWLHLYSYQSERSSLSTWIFSIAHHRLIDFYRNMHSLISWEILPELSSQELTPEEILISAENITSVKALLDALSDFERWLLTLRFVTRLSIAQIASRIGKSEEATKKIMSRLIKRLQQHYQRQDLEDLLAILLSKEECFYSRLDLSNALLVYLPDQLLKSRS